jgi:hypothetical protein
MANTSLLKKIESRPTLFIALLQEWIFGKVREEDVCARYGLNDVDRARLRVLYNAIRLGSPELHATTPGDRLVEVSNVIDLYCYGTVYEDEAAVLERLGL